MINLNTLIVCTTYELDVSAESAIQTYINNHDALIGVEPLPPEILAEEAIAGSFGIPSSDNVFITELDPRMSPATNSQDGLLSVTDKGNLDTAFSHISNVENPHTVTKAQVGLDNVDNTSDVNKPISSATQTALNTKLESSDIANFETSTELDTRDTNNRNRTNHTGTQLASTISDFGSSVEGNTQVALNTTHRGLTDNPHSVTKAQVGLGNVDNTSDINKPISSATQTALDGKENTFTKNTAFNKNFGTGTITTLGTTPSLGTSIEIPRFDHAHAHGNQTDSSLHALATQSAHGFLSLTDKIKLDSSYYVQNITTSSTTAGTYVTYLTFTPDVSFPSGTYVVMANGQYSTSASLSTITIALFLGSTEITNAQITAGYFQVAAANKLPYSILTQVSMTAATTLSIRFLSGRTSSTATLYSGKIYLVKVA